MFKLDDRKKAREHRAAVNSGAVKDMVASHGLAENGDVIGDDGKPVAGTAAKGYKPPEAEDNAGGFPDGDGGNGGGKVDYTKFKNHADLNAELAKLGKETPEGWTEDKPTVAEKQAILADLAKPAGGW